MILLALVAQPGNANKAHTTIETSCTAAVFSPAGRYSLDASLEPISGDFDGDGKVDLAFPYYPSPAGTHQMRFFFGDGAGGFPTASLLNMRYVESPIAIKYVGHLLYRYSGSQQMIGIPLNRNKNTLSILELYSRDIFSTGLSLTLNGTVQSVAVADFNADGTPDLAVGINVTTEAAMKPKVAIWLNNSSSFRALSDIDLSPALVNFADVAAGDFNADGKQDIVARDETCIVTLFGDGKGGFMSSAPTPLPRVVAQGELLPADFNQDGKLDVLLHTDFSLNPLTTILAGDGNGAFHAVYSTSIATAQSVKLADFNRDGRMDFVADTTNQGGTQHRLSLFLNCGNNQFALQEIQGEGGWVTVGDFTQDVKPDLAAWHPNGLLSVYRNNIVVPNTPPKITPIAAQTISQGISREYYSYNSEPSYTALPLATVSDEELLAERLTVTASNVPAGVTVTDLQNVKGNVRAKIAVACNAPTGQHPLTLTVTDDAGASTTAEVILHIAENLPPEILGIPEIVKIPVGLGTDLSIAIKDEISVGTILPGTSQLGISVSPPFHGSIGMFGSGYYNRPLRIVNFGLSGTHTVTLRYKDHCGAVGTKSFTLVVPSEAESCAFPKYQRIVLPNTEGLVSQQVRDFNGDGRLDIAANDSINNQIVLLQGNGLGEFAPPVPLLPEPIITLAGLQSGDYNGDGKADLFFGRLQSGNQRTYTVLFGAGDGTFSVAPQSASVPFPAASGDFNNDGKTDLVISSKTTYTLALSNGDGSFTKMQEDLIQVNPYFNWPPVVTGDINGDGNLDVAIATGQGGGWVGYFFGDGRGSLRAGGGVPSSARTRVAGIGDFNNDGKADVAFTTGDLMDDTVSASNRLSLGGTSYPSFALHWTGLTGDFNGDGNLDLAGIDQIVLGDGKGGSCAAPRGYPSSFFAEVGRAGDFDSDGKTDLLMVENGLWTLYLSRRAPAVNTPPVITIPKTVDLSQDQSNVAVELGEVWDAETPVGDLKVNVFLGGGVLYQVTNDKGKLRADFPVFCNQVAGEAEAWIYVSDGGGLGAVAVIKFNIPENVPPILGAYPDVILKDGLNQLAPVTPNRDAGKIEYSVYSPDYADALRITTDGVVKIRNNGKLGRYTATINATDECRTVSRATFSFTIAAPTNTCDTLSFSDPVEIEANPSPYGMATDDFNGDGMPDLVVTNRTINQITILLATNDNGVRSFRKADSYVVGNDPRAVAVSDFNGDRRADVAVANHGSNTVTILRGNGDGTFVDVGQFATGSQPFSVAVSDFNQDHHADLLLVHNSGGNLAILDGDGAGAFAAPRYFKAGKAPQPAVIGDFNKDGWPDVAVANYEYSGQDGGSILLGDGRGNLSPAKTFGVGQGIGGSPLAAGDFDTDGNLDLAIAKTISNRVDIVLGDGKGNFRSVFLGTSGYATLDFPTGQEPESIVAADFDGDGIPDLAVGNYLDNTITLRQGTIYSYYQPYNALFTGAYPLSLLTHDFNGDGKPDLAVANNGSGTVSVLLNSCTK